MTKRLPVQPVEVTFPYEWVERDRNIDGSFYIHRHREIRSIVLECPECNGTEFRQNFCGSATYDQYVQTDKMLSWDKRHYESDIDYVEGSFEPADDGWWCVACNTTCEDVLAQALDWYRDWVYLSPDQARRDLLDDYLREGKERHRQLERLHTALKRYVESTDE